MPEFTIKEPLILFEVGRAMSEGRDFKNSVEGWWKIDPEKASEYRLVLGKKANKIVCAFRPILSSWRQREDGRWGFDSNYAKDVWIQYVGKEVPIEYRTRAPFQYIDP